MSHRTTLMPGSLRVMGAGFVNILVLTTFLTATAEAACCRNYAEFAQQCRAQGGVPGVGATCTPQGGGSGGGGGFSGYSGSGGSANQQLMMGLAGAIGAAFAESLKAQEANQALLRQQQMEQAAEAMRLFQAAEQARIKELEARHQRLLSSLKGGLGQTELGLKRIEPGTLTLKSGTAMFGESNATGTLEYGQETKGLTLKMPDAPPSPTGTLIDKAAMEQVWTNYHQAADHYATLELQRQRLEADKQLAERIRTEAETHYQERQHQASVPPKDPSGTDDGHDQLAEAERLLQQAIELDQKATNDLKQATQDLHQAKRDLDRAEKDRAQAETSLDQPQPTRPQ